MTDKDLKGVLDKKYAVERLQKAELNFRFKVRARFVKNTIVKYLKTIPALLRQNTGQNLNSLNQPYGGFFL